MQTINGPTAVDSIVHLKTFSLLDQGAAPLAPLLMTQMLQRMLGIPAMKRTNGHFPRATTEKNTGSSPPA